MRLSATARKHRFIGNEQKKSFIPGKIYYLDFFAYEGYKVGRAGEQGLLVVQDKYDPSIKPLVCSVTEFHDYFEKVV